MAYPVSVFFPLVEVPEESHARAVPRLRPDSSGPAEHRLLQEDPLGDVLGPLLQRSTERKKRVFTENTYLRQTRFQVCAWSAKG